MIGAGLVAVGLGHGLGWLFVGGPLEGPLSWRKPTTFGISFGLVTITLAWLAQFLTLSDRALRGTLGALAAANTVEVSWVSVQRARGVASHFNFDTVLDAGLFAAAGVAIAVTVGVIAVYTVRSFTSIDAAPSMALAVRVGLVVLLISMATGVWMIVRGTLLGAPATTVAPAGSIKLAHAVGMHGVQLLCALAWIGSFGAAPQATQIRRVALASAGYVVLTALSVSLAGNGLPALPPGILSVAVATTALGCLLVPYVAAIASLAHHEEIQATTAGWP